jgi:trehalose-phosphatase
MESRLFIVSDRLPVAIDEDKGLQLSANGLFTDVKELLRDHTELYWAGSPGCNTIVWSEAIHKSPATDFTYLPIFINSYLEVSNQFLQTLLTHLHPGDTIWIHGQHLLLLPDMLRKEMPELTIVYFLQTTSTTWNEELLKGILGADLISSPDAAQFLLVVQMTLGLEHDQNIIRHDNRLIKVDVLNDIQTSIKDIKKKREDFKVKFLDTYLQKELLDSYQHALNRLILLDYDGTLVPFSPNPADAIPGDDLLQLIRNLNTDRNTVCIISGRNHEWLDQCLGYCNVNMIAEHGACFKYQDQDWTSDNLQTDWIGSVKEIMKTYVRRCPHTFIEEKQFSVVWHYRNAVKNQGAVCAAELRSELTAFARDRRLKVAMGNKIVEVKHGSINKGEATRKLLTGKQFDFILAIGDDYTDEDMFKALTGQTNCYTIKVGNEASYARYNLFTPHTVIALLETINHITIRDINGRVD